MHEAYKEKKQPGISIMSRAFTSCDMIQKVLL